jgi:hypothetical protein
MVKWRRYIGLFTLGMSATVQAASVTMQVSTTVVLVQCPTEQRTRIRACAPSAQLTSSAPFKAVVTIESPPGQREVVGPRQEILVDPSRQVMVKTLLY